MKSFVIDRKRWYRGKGASGSRLLRSEDGKMCCLGLYLESVGMESSRLLGVTSPMAVHEIEHLIPEEASWLFKDTNEYGSYPDNSADVRYLIQANDSIIMTAEEREAAVVATFAKAGIQVTFTEEADEAED